MENQRSRQDNDTENMGLKKNKQTWFADGAVAIQSMRLRSFREEAHVETPEHDIIIMFCETRRMVCETRKLGIKANHVRPNSR